MNKILQKIWNKIYRYYYTSSSDRLLKYYRSGGGEDW